MNCFIASAFDHDDVDAIYDLAIRPILKALKIRPTRVDRVEHNDDIDDRIFTLIDQSQFCIADLTFARPSVYYEAGYAFGSGKSVIYIARHDHFRARNDDPPGNLRVHFDLQMKNIVAWVEPNEAFKKRLRGRIRHVLKPILARKQITDAEREEEKRFTSTSQHARLVALLERGKSLLQSRSYSLGKFPDKRLFGDNVYHLYFEKFSGKTYRQIHIIVCPAVTKTGVRMLHLLWHPRLPKQEYDKLNAIKSVCMIVSLRSVRQNTITTLFPSWTPVTNRILTRYDMSSFLGDEMPHTAKIVFIDGVKSLSEFSDRFGRLLKEPEES